MFVALLAAGAIPLQAGAGVGVFDVPVERLALAARVQSTAAAGGGSPLGAAVWQQAVDPADHLPFGFSFSDLFDTDETIAAVERIAVASTGAALGVSIDGSSGFAPIVDDATQRRIQIWIVVDAGQQSSSAFDAGGVAVPITFRVLTSKERRFERTAVLTVRNL